MLSLLTNVFATCLETEYQFPYGSFYIHHFQSGWIDLSKVKMADRDVLELANDEEFGDGGMDDMDGEVGLLSHFAIQDYHSFLKNCHCCPP